jgi:hypothetical protein
MPCGFLVVQASDAAGKVLFVIPSEARDLIFLATLKKQQIPRANTALRNDMLRVFPQPLQPEDFLFRSFKTHRLMG